MVKYSIARKIYYDRRVNNYAKHENFHTICTFTPYNNRL